MKKLILLIILLFPLIAQADSRYHRVLSNEFKGGQIVVELGEGGAHHSGTIICDESKGCEFPKDPNELILGAMKTIEVDGKTQLVVDENLRDAAVQAIAAKLQAVKDAETNEKNARASLKAIYLKAKAKTATAAEMRDGFALLVDMLLKGGVRLEN